MSKSTNTGGPKGFSRRSVLTLAGASLLPLAAAACGKGAGGEYPSNTVRIMAPADPGGGWDTTARELQACMEKAKLADSAEVYNVKSVAGIAGLNQFVKKAHGKPHELMITGLVMVAGIVDQQSSTGLSHVTPIATLTQEQEVIVVHKDSPYETIDDLIAGLVEKKTKLIWGGGSKGGTDEVVALMLADTDKAKKAGASPKDVKYIGTSGGGDSIKDVLNGDLDVAISGVSEYAEQIKSGDFRALAVSGAKAEDTGKGETETLTDLGYDVEVLNWRGIVAPKGIDSDQKKDITKLITDTCESKEWKATCDKEGWIEFLKTGEDCTTFFNDENGKVTKIYDKVGR
ncbi:MAG: tripartite tricarboxylate transporter substrate binding protein [Stackebrandtia sp.]